LEASGAALSSIHPFCPEVRARRRGQQLALPYEPALGVICLVAHRLM